MLYIITVQCLSLLVYQCNLKMVPQEEPRKNIKPAKPEKMPYRDGLLLFSAKAEKEATDNEKSRGQNLSLDGLKADRTYIFGFLVNG